MSRRGWRVAAAVVAWGLAAAGAHAQEVRAEPSAVQRCLTAASDSPQPVYPRDLERAGEGAAVKVSLAFTIPDGAPAITVVSSSGDRRFVDAVRDHARQLRLPCLAEFEAPAVLDREYVFQPETRKVSWSSNDAAAERSRRLLACVKTPPPPEYPHLARRYGVTGRVVAQLTYTAPDQAPDIRLFAPTELLHTFGPGIKRWARDLRMPCLDDARPFKASAMFVYRFQNEQAPGFKDIDFVRFLASVKDIDQQTLVLDTHEMGCPFDIQLHYRQPYLPNVVGEYAPDNPARRPLLAWLRGAELRLTERQREAAFGDQLSFTVPCTQIRLEPQAAR